MDLGSSAKKAVFGTVAGIGILASLGSIVVKLCDYTNCPDSEDFSKLTCYLYGILYIIPDLIWCLAFVIGTITLCVTSRRVRECLITTLVFQILALVSNLFSTILIWRVIPAIAFCGVLSVLSLIIIIMTSTYICCKQPKHAKCQYSRLK